MLFGEYWRSALRCYLVAVGVLLSGLAFAAEPSTFTVEVRGKGPPVILIPGLACTGEVWQTTVDDLADRYECHILSLKGFGGTEPGATIPEPFIPTVRDDILAYVRDRKLDHPVFVGHSLGGMITLDLAETAPDVPRAIVIVDSYPCPMAVLNPGVSLEGARAKAHELRDQLKVKTETLRGIERIVVRGMIASDKDFEPILEMVGKSDKDTVTKALFELLVTDLRPGLSKITCPALILGAVPVQANPEDVRANFVAQYAPLTQAKTVIFEKARHFIMYDEPEKFREAIREGLRAGGK